MCLVMLVLVSRGLRFNFWSRMLCLVKIMSREGCRFECMNGPCLYVDHVSFSMLESCVCVLGVIVCMY